MFDEKDSVSDNAETTSQIDDSPETNNGSAGSAKDKLLRESTRAMFCSGEIEGETKTISVAEIEEHNQLKIRDHYDRDEVGLLEQKIRWGWEDLPLIVVIMIGGIYFIVDGVYRWLASQKAGLQEIKVKVFKGTLQEAFLYRIRKNSGHGVPLTREERERIAITILSNPEGWYYAESLIKFLSGVSDKTIVELRKRHFPTLEIPKIKRAIRNGKWIEIDTSKIGKRAKSKSAQESLQNTESNLETGEINFPVIDRKLLDSASAVPILIDFEFSSDNDATEDSSSQSARSEDDVEDDPNLAAQAQARRNITYGDIFLIENLKNPSIPHIICCLDSTDENAVRQIFSLFRAGLLLSDLPYNRNFKAKVGKGKVAHELQKIANDNLSPSQYRGFIRKIFKNCSQVLEDGSAYFLFFGLHETIPTFYFIERLLGSIRKLIVWNKKGIKQNFSPHFRDGQECAFFGNTGEKMRYWNGGKNTTTMFNEAQYSRSKWELPKQTHPCPKPIPILADFIALTLEEKGTVFDPLMGSGSTIVAADITGRRGVGIELIPAFVAVALERFETKGHQWEKTTLEELPGKLVQIEQGDWSWKASK